MPKMARKMNSWPEVVFTHWNDHMTTSSSRPQARPDGFLSVFMFRFFFKESCSGMGSHWSSSEVIWSIKHSIAPDGIFWHHTSIAQDQLEVTQDYKSWEHTLRCTSTKKVTTQDYDKAQSNRDSGECNSPTSIGARYGTAHNLRTVAILPVRLQL